MTTTLKMFCWLWDWCDLGENCIVNLFTHILKYFNTSGLFGSWIYIWRAILLLRLHHSIEKKTETIEPRVFFWFEVSFCLYIHKVQYNKLPFTAGKMIWKIKKIERKHLEPHRLNVIFIKNQIFTAANLISIFQTHRNMFPALNCFQLNDSWYSEGFIPAMPVSCLILPALSPSQE